MLPTKCVYYRCNTRYCHRRYTLKRTSVFKQFCTDKISRFDISLKKMTTSEKVYFYEIHFNACSKIASD